MSLLEAQNNMVAQAAQQQAATTRVAVLLATVYNVKAHYRNIVNALVACNTTAEQMYALLSAGNVDDARVCNFMEMLVGPRFLEEYEKQRGK